MLPASPLFLTYGALATSDLFFFALYNASLTLAFLAARDRRVVFVMILALGQILLMGFNTYLPLYYLFLLPLIGAAVGHSAGQIIFGPGDAPDRTIRRIVAGFALSGIAILAILNASLDAHR